MGASLADRLVSSAGAVVLALVYLLACHLLTPGLSVAPGFVWLLALRAWMKP